MGLFSSKTEGGIMDAIRCDQQQYLIWKWSPDGMPSKKENAIRYSSSLRVKDGEVAVFIYKQKDGPMQDFIEGPFDQSIKTANFPILASIVGLAFGGASPFQAEVYFINLSGNIQIKWGLPMFDNFDPRYPDFGIPTTSRGSLTFNITDYKNFIKLNRMIGFDIEDFKSQIRSGFIGKMKSVLIDAPIKHGIPVIQIERHIETINEIAKNNIVELTNDFGVNLKRLDIESIEIDKDSEGYRNFKAITKDITSSTVKVQSEVNIKNIYATQAINQENVEESMRIQREEMQRAQQLATEAQYIQTHQINISGEIGKEMASHIGEIGQSGGLEGGGGGMNPGSMMAGMAIGGAVGNQMAVMLNQQMGNLNQPKTPVSQQGSIVCPKCNTVNQPDTKYCGSCGTPVIPQPAQQEQARTCNNCKSQVPASTKFCPNCGTPALQEKFCLDCGTKVAPGGKFCPNCGNPIG